MLSSSDTHWFASMAWSMALESIVLGVLELVLAMQTKNFSQSDYNLKVELICDQLHLPLLRNNCFWLLLQCLGSFWNCEAQVHIPDYVAHPSWLVVWVLWYINFLKLFNAKSIFIQIISPISNDSV